MKSLSILRCDISLAMLYYNIKSIISECSVFKSIKELVLFCILLGTLTVQKTTERDQNIYSCSKLIRKCSMLRDGHYDMITVYYSN